MGMIVWLLVGICGYGIGYILSSAGYNLKSWELWVGFACSLGMYLLGVSHLFGFTQ